MNYFCEKKQDKFLYLFLTNTKSLASVKAVYHLTEPEKACYAQYPLHNNKAVSSEVFKQYLEEDVFPLVQKKQIKYLLVTEAKYFKLLTGLPKVTPYLGYVVPCKLKEGLNIMYIPSPGAVYYNPPEMEPKVGQVIDQLESHASANYQEPGSNLITKAEFPKTTAEIKAFLDKIATYPKLTIDIETFSLKHPTSGIGSITFCWNDNEGGAFVVDDLQTRTVNSEVRGMLREFFDSYEGTCIYHNISFDGSILIYQLYMKDILDTQGLLQGMKSILKNWDDTKLIAYLATNSCARTSLSLKSLAQPFAGNWAQEEIEDISRIPEEDLLKYNVIDGLSTWYVYNTYQPQMVKDNQVDIYEQIFKPAIKDIIQMQLTGLPVDMSRVHQFKTTLEEELSECLDKIYSSEIIQSFTHELNLQWVNEKNSKLKKKRVTIEDANQVFNPKSNLHLRKLLFEYLNLPIVEKTDSGLPGTSSSVLSTLVLDTPDEAIVALLKSLLAYSEMSKIYSTFVPLLENAFLGPDGWHYVFGSFNLGGTVSGRLSSSNP